MLLPRARLQRSVAAPARPREVELASHRICEVLEGHRPLPTQRALLTGRRLEAATSGGGGAWGSGDCIHTTPPAESHHRVQRRERATGRGRRSEAVGPGLFSADDGLECRVLGRSASLSGSAPTWMDPRAGETTEGRRHDGTRLASLRCVCQVRVSGGAWYFTGTRGRGRRLGARKSSALLRRPERRQLRVGPKEPVIWWSARQRAGELSEAPAVGPSQLKTGKEMDINA